MNEETSTTPGFAMEGPPSSAPRAATPANSGVLLPTSIVICTHNRRRLLETTLESLRRLEVPRGLVWEVLVVDNASSDSTASMLAEFGRRHELFPLRTVTESRKGIAFARNTGVEQARGEIVAFVDDDVIVSPRWLSVLVEAFTSDSELTVVGGRLKANPEGPMPEWLLGMNPAPLGLIDFGDCRKILDVPYLATANCAFKKSAIVAAGMFDVRRGRRPDRLYADEDTDMVARIQSSSGRVLYEPDMSALHFVPIHRMTRAYFRRWYREKGEGAGIVGQTGGRSLFGIPLFEYRHVLVGFVQYVRDLFRGRPVFQHELALQYFRGYVIGRVKRWNNDEG